MTVQGQNAVEMDFLPASGRRGKDRLADDRPVTLILRPDIEDRKFSRGPQKRTPVRSSASRLRLLAGKEGFWFQPHGHHELGCFRHKRPIFPSNPNGSTWFTDPQEAQRGQDPDSDLFSPGYFSGPLAGGESEILPPG
jgi:starch synthase (maltosyl-transferring)